MVGGLLREAGGLVLVIGRPLPQNEWNRIADALSSSAEGPELVVHAEASATAIELFYPQEGTYTFSLHSPHARALHTRELSVGAGMVMDPETGRDIEWPSQSAIHVLGRHHDEAWSRSAADAFSQTFRDGSADEIVIDHYEGGRMISLSEAAQRRFVR